ncbi:hypothetical protein ILYODFUR_037416 [Ilyodon furcidens]|uniref:Uncharacterized protein n=1 Tax=Ilyodon furcidens TaxID=33524 RepID=A0ABV0UYI8_9TELE
MGVFLPRHISRISQRSMPIRRFGGHRSLVPYSQTSKLSYGYTKMNISRSDYRVFSANSSTGCTELANKISE